MATFYSTLPEIDKRAEAATLEVRFSYPGLEAIPEPPRKDPWWRRHRFLLVVTILVIVGGAVGGTVAGLVVRSRTSETVHDNNREGITTSPSTSASATLAPITSPVSSSPTVVPTTTTTTSSSSSSSRQNPISVSTSRASTPTTTRSTPPSTTSTSGSPPRRTPNLPVRLGNVEIPGRQKPGVMAFLDNGTPESACAYTIFQDEVGDNPCGKSFQLADGLTYFWNGCGGPTWITWLDPTLNTTISEYFGDCVSAALEVKCGEKIVHGEYFCEKKK